MGFNISEFQFLFYFRCTTDIQGIMDEFGMEKYYNLIVIFLKRNKERTPVST
jgi:hypothetical protein